VPLRYYILNILIKQAISEYAYNVILLNFEIEVYTNNKEGIERFYGKGSYIGVLLASQFYISTHAEVYLKTSNIAAGIALIGIYLFKRDGQLGYS
jgi:hypothetical protein